MADSRGGKGRGGKRGGGRGKKNQPSSSENSPAAPNPSSSENSPAAAPSSSSPSSSSSSSPSSFPSSNKNRNEKGRRDELFPQEREEMEDLSQREGEIRQTINDAKAKIQEKRASIRSTNEEKESLRRSLRVLHEKVGNIISEIKENQQKARSTDESLRTKRGEAKQIRQKLPYRNEEDPDFSLKVNQAYNEKIRQLERQIEDQNLNGATERRILAQMNEINKTKGKILDEYRKVNEAIEKGLALKSQLQFEIEHQQQKIDGLRLEEKPLKSRLAELSEGDQQTNKQIDELKAGIDAQKEKMQEIALQKRTKYGELKQKKDEYYQNKRHEQDLRQKKRDEENAKRQKEDRSRSFALELERCDMVMRYLKAQSALLKAISLSTTLNGRLENKEGGNKDSGQQEENRKEGEEGEEEGSGEKKKKQLEEEEEEEEEGTAETTDPLLEHPANIVEDFEMLSILLPKRLSAIDASLASIQVKREWYLKLDEFRHEFSKQADGNIKNKSLVLDNGESYSTNQDESQVD